MNSPPLICVAAFYQGVQCFKYLLLNGASPLSTDQYGNNASYFATIGGSLEIFRMCEQIKPHDDQCAFLAVSYWKTDILNWILENDNVDLSSRDKNNDSFYAAAAATNNISFNELEYLNYTDNSIYFQNLLK